MGNCLAPSPPPVVFTICPADGKGHDFGEKPQSDAICRKCGQIKEEVDRQCGRCRQDDHEWITEAVPVPQATPPPQGPPGTAQAIPVTVVYKCAYCGLRRRVEDGVNHYDDFYMYGGGHMMGLDMALTFGIMGAASAAYADPMYGEYYGDDMMGGDMGFEADEDMDMGFGDF